MMNAGPPIDDSLLELFRAEAAAQTAVMAQDLDAMGEGAAALKKAENVYQAVLALKGAARLVGLDQAAQLAQAMEKNLAGARARSGYPMQWRLTWCDAGRHGWPVTRNSPAPGW